MTDRIALALAIHNHQPVGNFGWVIAFNHERAYQPLLEALERHPGVRLALHYSGPLLEWLRAERPEFLTRLAELVARDQVEIMGGGYYEPVLASLPEADRVGQLTRMSDELTRLFGRRAARRVAGGTGVGAGRAHLAGRRGLPAGPSSMTPISGPQRSPRRPLWGAYTTDDQGRRLAIFGTEQGPALPHSLRRAWTTCWLTCASTPLPRGVGWA